MLKTEGLTLLAITHDIRSPLLAEYDKILYMRQGKIEESGTYEELCRKGKAFAEFVKLV